MSRFLFVLTAFAALMPQSSHAMGKHRLSDAGMRLARDESAYRLHVTEGGEVFAATSTRGIPGMQWIRHRGLDGRWRTILAQPTTSPGSWAFHEDRQVSAFWHSGPRVDAAHPLWVAWQEPRVLALRSWDGKAWKEHKRLPVANGWFMGFAGLGTDHIWAFGKHWKDSVHGDASDFAWLWNGSEWIETQGDLASGVGGQGMEAMLVFSETEAYALQNWDFRRWDGNTWRREHSPFEGVAGVKVIGGNFVLATTMVGAYGSKIVAWNPREGAPKVISAHPLYAAGETEPTDADWLHGTSLSRLWLNSMITRQIPGCKPPSPWGDMSYCYSTEIHRLRWDGSSWTRLQNDPALSHYLKKGLHSQWPLEDGSMWVGGMGYIDRVGP